MNLGYAYENTFESPDGWNCQKNGSYLFENLPTIADPFSVHLEVIDEEFNFITRKGYIKYQYESYYVMHQSKSYRKVYSV
jgi:hypothetical protein